MCNILKSQQPVVLNITVEEEKALTDLNQDQPICITKADEGYVKVILNRWDYESMVADHLRDKPCERIEGKVNVSLNKSRDYANRYLSGLNKRLGKLLWFPITP